MLGRVRNFWLRLTDTLWFVPSLITLFMSALAVVMVEVSSLVDADALSRFPRVFGASADSSRALLSAIAGAMITVAGLTFSLTMVAVTQASSQYTSRILRNFMRDRGNQSVLGIYVGMFAYCILVVRTIRSGEEGQFLPSLAVVLGIAMAIGSVAVLLFFVHHIADTLQASTIISRIAAETVVAVERAFPSEIGRGAGRRLVDSVSAAASPDGTPIPTLPTDTGEERERWPVCARATGYVQAVDDDRLLELAESFDVEVRLVPAIGDFVIEGHPVAWVRPSGAPVRSPNLAESSARDLAKTLTVNSYRTVEQDPAFGIRQLVDIALKALSPGINDTTTAINCIDYLGAVLVRVVGRPDVSSVRVVGGVVRVVIQAPTFNSLLSLAFDEIRQNATTNVSVLCRLIATVTTLASYEIDSARRKLLGDQLTRIAEAAQLLPLLSDRTRMFTLVGDARVRA